MDDQREGRMRSRFRGCLVATACGDARGLPWEMMTHAQISAATDGRGVTELVPIPKTHPVWESGLDQPLGSTSDDWALVGATARALTAIGIRRSPDRQAAMIVARERQITLLQTLGAGWGPGTVKGTEEIGRWLDGIPGGRAPWVEVPPVDATGIGKGAGCGPAMQIGPLGLMDAVCHDGIDPAAWCRLMGFMTHGNVEATVAAEAMARCVSFAFRLTAGKLAGDIEKSREREVILATVTKKLETRYGKSGRVVSALRLLGEPGFLDGPDRLREEIKPGFLCWESVPFAIGTWLRHIDDPAAAITEAVNAGGDTDSTAAMSGALAGTYAGLEAIPQSWQDQVPNATVAITVADRLFDALVHEKHGE